jgi:plasmid stability protein
MATLQVKGMDDRLYETLSARAAQDHRSISQEVVMIIEEFLSRPENSPHKNMRAFLELIGSWEDDRSAEEIVEDIRKNRRSGGRMVDQENVFD